MNNKSFERKQKPDAPILAILYDFDKTLSPDDMQAQGFIQSVGYDVEEFWRKSNELAELNDMDQNLAYMYLMMEESEGKFAMNRKNLEEYGSKVSLYPGAEEWFERIRAYGKSRGVIVEHYIISSGLKEMIEGTSPAKKGAFERIYASSFYFNEKGAAKWPAQVVNYTNKTQFLFRIEKGVLDVNDLGVNDFFPPEKIRIPFRNMVYIGDSDTDIPCMRLVNSLGGHSIGVYDSKTEDKSKVYKMMREGRIKYFAATDYTEGSELDSLVKSIIDRTAANELLENVHYRCKKENEDADRDRREAKRRRSDDIDSLSSSHSFAATHTIIEKLAAYSDWTKEEGERLASAALSNRQVRTILRDPDVKEFFESLLAASDSQGAAATELRRLLEEK